MDDKLAAILPRMIRNFAAWLSGRVPAHTINCVRKARLGCKPFEGPNPPSCECCPRQLPAQHKQPRPAPYPTLTFLASKGKEPSISLSAQRKAPITMAHPGPHGLARKRKYRAHFMAFGMLGVSVTGRMATVPVFRGWKGLERRSQDEREVSVLGTGRKWGVPRAGLWPVWLQVRPTRCTTLPVQHPALSVSHLRPSHINSCFEQSKHKDASPPISASAS
ncbi:uncharacterized protein B0H64DRAFT_231613 [Chaetomium fimeti]|jgi:hypothetical protein|uniref:Uncharacterized protein n=1 Tax=Chaetomium fimeti TaxID=1854472 RepID=A0AAE0H9P6_9PEZI|nr:hypothetical protein B0H64DRAFT_231613 [Chaetomium fimeti]